MFESLGSGTFVLSLYNISDQYRCPCADRGKEYSVLTCGNDHLVKIWRLVLWKRSASSHQCAVEMIRSLKSHSSSVTSVCFDNSGAMFASTSMDKTTILWQVQLWKQIDGSINPHLIRSQTGYLRLVYQCTR